MRREARGPPDPSRGIEKGPARDMQRDLRPRRATMRDVPGSLAVLRELASYPGGDCSSCERRVASQELVASSAIARRRFSRRSVSCQTTVHRSTYSQSTSGVLLELNREAGFFEEPDGGLHCRAIGENGDVHVHGDPGLNPTIDRLPTDERGPKASLIEDATDRDNQLPGGFRISAQGEGPALLLAPTWAPGCRQ